MFIILTTSLLASFQNPSSHICHSVLFVLSAMQFCCRDIQSNPSNWIDRYQSIGNLILENHHVKVRVTCSINFTFHRIELVTALLLKKKKKLNYDSYSSIAQYITDKICNVMYLQYYTFITLSYIAYTLLQLYLNQEYQYHQNLPSPVDLDLKSLLHGFSSSSASTRYQHYSQYSERIHWCSSRGWEKESPRVEGKKWPTGGGEQFVFAWGVTSQTPTSTAPI